MIEILQKNKILKIINFQLIKGKKGQKGQNKLYKNHNKIIIYDLAQIKYVKINYNYFRIYLGNLAINQKPI